VATRQRDTSPPLFLIFSAIAAALFSYYSFNDRTRPEATIVSDDMSGFKSVAYFVNWVFFLSMLTASSTLTNVLI
jgi:hypothetical protein